MTASLRARLAGGERLLAIFNLIPATEIIELVAIAGFDVVIVDMEHGPHELSDVRQAILAAEAAGLHTVVRVRTSAAASIGAVLDLGANGVLVPQIESAEHAVRAVRAARFAPRGERGANPWVRAARYGQRENWFATADDDVATLVMVEGRAALTELPEILAVPGLDAIFLGPMDLSHSLGVPGQIDHPSVVDRLESAVRLAAGHGVATGLFAPGVGRAAHWWGRGAGLVASGVDTEVIRSAMSGATAAAHSAAAGRPATA
ncbi:aldolase [Solihabitans fulvus]|uniref:Aldolase n=1 Tax=Solihabitans fulvus TaxID=1892852 RepID=A0A5B2WLG1_9PSEU|nr:aldolase/citrate lyase family protein [Solihabitans fulvus]KAA2252843.1 aldolase [Solihabitans fulvus]